MYQKIADEFLRIKTIITSHGAVSYMRSYDRERLGREVNLDTRALRYDFCLDPESPSYSYDNFICSLGISYSSGGEYTCDDGLCCDYTRRVTLSHGSGEITSENLKRRENFISMILLLMEMIEAITPEKIKIVKKTPEVLVEEAKLAAEQRIAERIFAYVDRRDLKHLRVNGNGKLVKIHDSYVTDHGGNPPEGNYRFSLQRYLTKRTSAVINYYLKVFTMPDGSSVMKVFRLKNGKI